MSVKIGDHIDLGNFPLLLAPMEDVSDPPFRYVCKQNGVDMMYTEFISSEGLIRDAAKSRQKLDIFEYERPIGIQIFGSEIEHMRQSSEICSLANPDLIDINYGCPVKNVVCKGAGSSLLQDIDKMVAMTKAVVEATHLPVTVKTRLGWDDNTKNVYEVAERLQDVGIKALSIHGRTRAQMYKGQADWSMIRDVKRNPRIKIPIFGNGDIDSVEKAAAWRQEFEVDGIMIGRASIGYPWIFREIKHFFETGQRLEGPTIAERVEVCRTHLTKSIEWKGEKTGIFEMRRHYANYFKGIPNFKEYRMKLVGLQSHHEIHEVLDEIQHQFAEEII
ncbi:TIM-barrel protein, nifR3 family [Sphingobacterium spiritivorum ATCC 33300]|uniref:tRNA-dihydrouridine synthase n=2 Tax=Sphingobacterium spiritivorum TaxID=258 RepID=A0A380BZM7_SPHSI|nr:MULTISPECIES: tRNA dihydrouridine synthase DusB [Sphingobacterium]EEI91288.1 TIM-barrel protein, nifR3 family [Sphingobacterium spiritivorum ATCC 33300]QQS97397.1 tRNA dihydrouridine synthase DusB [Sphingobacterium spiritivorum]QQT27971.1 tRNA dihydrouridine synthase DusB [Sphingobacterium spiritivorum]SUJ10270.1 Probable tRNA-dihydrouridine synthase [Sphingobacterium spiritivorum]